MGLQQVQVVRLETVWPGGKGSLPLAGTAVYMTAYSRLENDPSHAEKGRPWEKAFQERPWLYQTPMDILIKASNGSF